MNTEKKQPLTTLEDVRSEFNIVAAVSGLQEAETLAAALEEAEIPSDNIALLGAYPAGPGDTVDESGSAAPLTNQAADPPIRDGNVAVGVHSEHEQMVTTAGRVMQRHGVLSVNRFQGS